MTFTIIIPAFNEYDNLIKNVPYLAQRYNDQALILIIENGSDTAPDLDYLDNVKVLNIWHKGLGIALRTGLREATTPCVVFLPADLSFDLSFVDLAVPIIEHCKWFDLVIGSKGLRESKVQRPIFRQFASQLYNSWYNLIYDELRVRDITGVKAYKRKAILPLLDECKSDGIFFEIQLINALRKHRQNILEVPVTVKDFHASKFVPWQKVR